MKAWQDCHAPYVDELVALPKQLVALRKMTYYGHNDKCYTLACCAPVRLPSLLPLQLEVPGIAQAA